MANEMTLLERFLRDEYTQDTRELFARAIVDASKIHVFELNCYEITIHTQDEWVVVHDILDATSEQRVTLAEFSAALAVTSESANRE